MAHGQVESVWFAETSRPTKQIITVFQGETIALAPVMQSYGRAITNITTATLYWQTADMNMSWWSKPASVVDGRISAIFHPTNDVGAKEYTFFIGSSSGLGTSYRAYGQFKMQSSPGYAPTTLPPPLLYPLAADLTPYVLDLLPPYDPLGSALAVSQTLSQTIAEIEVSGGGGTLTNELDPVAMAAIADLIPTIPPFFDGTVHQVVTNVTPAYVVTESCFDGYGSIFPGQIYVLAKTIVETIPASPPYPSYVTTNIYYYIDNSPLPPYLTYQHGGPYGGFGWSLETPFGYTPYSSDEMNAIELELTTGNFEQNVFLSATNIITIVTNTIIYATEPYVDAAIAGIGPSASTQTLASVVSAGNYTHTNIPAIDAKAVVSVRDDNSERIAVYGAGTTQPGGEFYSTYAPAVIGRSATGAGGLFVQGPVSNSVGAEVAGILKIMDEPTANEGAGQRGGITLADRTIHDFGEIEAQIDAQDIADLNAWGRRLPDGKPNPASNTAVVVNSPMIIASGLGFETSGNYAVCVTSGAEMQVVTNGGWVCFKPSTWTDGIGFRTVDMIVPAVPNSFQVFNGGQTNGYASIKYPLNAGDTNAPPVSYSTDLITWTYAPEQQAANDGVNWTVTVTADQPRMYFKGASSVSASDRIYSAYPHEFDAGIAVGGIAPVVYDAVITVEHGGRTYRIPTQEVN